VKTSKQFCWGKINHLFFTGFGSALLVYSVNVLWTWSYPTSLAKFSQNTSRAVEQNNKQTKNPKTPQHQKTPKLQTLATVITSKHKYIEILGLHAEDRHG